MPYIDTTATDDTLQLIRDLEAFIPDVEARARFVTACDTIIVHRLPASFVPFTADCFGVPGVLVTRMIDFIRTYEPVD